MTACNKQHESQTTPCGDHGGSGYRRLARLAALFAIVISSAVLVGWGFDIEAVKRVAPTYVAMNPMTALAFILAGPGLWIIASRERVSPRHRYMVSVCAVLVIAIGLFKLISLAWVDVNVDQILFPSRLDGDVQGQPNRMAPNTAVCFVLLGCSLLLLACTRRRHPYPSQILALATALIALLALIGYTYSVTAFYGIASFIPMAVHTAACFFVLSLGVLVARPHDGFMSLMTSDTTGGQLARRFVPAVIVIPPTLSALRVIGEQVGLFDPMTGISLITATSIVLVLALIWWTGDQLRRTDIARMNAERASRRHTDQISDLYHNAPCGYHSLDGEGVFIEINATELAWLGYARDELVGKKTFAALLTPESAQLFVERFPVFKEEGEIREVEFDMVRRDGSILPVLLSAIAIRDDDGNFEATRSTVFDITERRKANEANARLASIVEHTHDAVISEDLDGRILSWNGGAERMFGFTAEEVVGRPISLLVPPGLPSEIPQLQHRIVRGEEIEQYETVRMTKGGDRLHVSLTLSPIMDERGDIVGVSKIARDITSRKKADEQLAQAKALAEEANRTKSEFLANMSHEIRTPMMAIIGYADLLLDVNQTTSDRLNAVNVIRRNANHLLAIINDILDLSKIEAGELHVEQVECSPCQVIYEVVSLMRARAAEKSLEFKTHLEGSIPEIIQTDPTRLRQILINLVGNAIKFTESGWVKLIVELQQPERGDGEPMLRFDVIDTGIGMSEQQVANLFKPFGQADSSTTRKFGGTGLGLVISQRFANLLGGEITIDSAPGRGSTFSVYVSTGSLAEVRLIDDCSEAIEIRDFSTDVGRDDVPLNGRILLAEDGFDNRQLLAQYLRIAGAEVSEAKDGREACILALEAMRHGRPFDLIVMDMQMPELDGYGAASKLRTNGYDRPIVALTAHAMADDREKCLQAGCTDYLSKPVTRGMLLRTLALHLGGEPSDESREAASQEGKREELLLSDLTDEAIMPYLNAFIDSMPSKTNELEELLAEENLEQLRDVMHQLKGSSGLFGFIPISNKAAEVGDLLRCGRPVSVIRKEMQRLTTMMDRASRSNSHDASAQSETSSSDARK